MSTVPLTPVSGGGTCLSPDALEPADILVTAGSHGISRTIRAMTTSHVSHAALYVGGGQIVEAISEGVVQRAIRTALSGSNLAVVYRYRGLTEAQARTIVGFAVRQVGAGYDYSGALASGTSHAPARLLLGPGLILLVNAGTGSRDKFFCSELVLEAYRRAGIPLTAIRPSRATPQRIVEAAGSGRLEYIGHLLTGEFRA